MPPPSDPPRRLLPDEPLPPYAYTPGRTPHPISHPAGHSFGHSPAPLPPWSPLEWSRCHPFLRGFDLFHAGYYWEAHEAWEQVWLAAGRQGAAADLLKGLIKLAAAGVQAKAGKPAGTALHLARAAELFRQAAREQQLQQQPPQQPAAAQRLLGMSPPELCVLAEGLAAAHAADQSPAATSAALPGWRLPLPE